MKCNRERKYFCTLYTHILLLQFIYIHTLSLTQTHTNTMHTKINSSCQKKRLKHKWTVCSFKVCVQHACSNQGLLSETFLFKDFKEDLHTVTHVR